MRLVRCLRDDQIISVIVAVVSQLKRSVLKENFTDSIYKFRQKSRFVMSLFSLCPIVEGVKCQALTLDLPMHHLALSSDELTLSVCGACEETALMLDFYDVRTFFNKVNSFKKKNTQHQHIPSL